MPSLPAHHEHQGFQPPRSGMNNVAEYQASGLPYSVLVTATGSADVATVRFPFVTMELYIQNRSANSMSIGWTRNGVLGTNKYVLASSGSVEFKIRCKELFLTGIVGQANVTAALTQISSRNMPTITGSFADPITGEFGYFSGSTDRNWGWNGVG